MKISRIVKISQKQLSSHKLRTALTLLGMIVGVSAVIITVAVGTGVQKEILSKIEDMGTNLLIVNAGQVRTFAGRKEVRGLVTTLSLRDVEAILNRCNSVSNAAPVQSKKMQVKFGNLSTNTTITGTTPEYQHIRKFYPGRGWFFSNEDNVFQRRVAVIGVSVVENLFETDDPLNKTILIGKIPFEIIGVMESKGVDINGVDQDNQIFIPIRTVLRRVFNLDYINAINIQATEENLMSTAQYQVRELLREQHRLNRKDAPDDFLIQSQEEIIKTHRQTTDSFTNLIGGIAAISLLIGGIGILSIMLISIKERTNEIGLRMAVGAKRKDVLTQFLIESAILSIEGGVIGIFLGISSSVIIGMFTKWPTSVSGVSIAIAVGFSLLIGTFFGVYPARKASKLDPIEALRSE